MIPILYDGSETSFTSNGLGRLRDCLTCVVTEERNGIYECDFTYPVDGANFSAIQPGRVIGVTHDDNGDIQPFDIVSVTKPINGIVTFHAVHISYRQSEYTLSMRTPSDLAQAFYLLKNYSEPPYANPFVYNADFTSSAFMAAADGTPRTVRQYLGGVEGSILDTYGGEYKFDVWAVNLLRERGVVRDFTIRYGVNLLDYTEETDIQGAYNACIPFWKGADSSGQDTIVQGTLAESGLSTSSGRTVCVPLDLTDKFEDMPTPSALTAYAESMMRSRQTNLPTKTIKVDFIRLQDSAEYAGFAGLLQCNLCDTIGVVFPEYNMEGRFKIVKTTYDVLEDKYTEMELGALSTTLAEALGISNTLDRSSGSGGGSSFENLYVENTLTVDGDFYLGGHTTPVGTVKSDEGTCSLATAGSLKNTGVRVSLEPGVWIVDYQLAVPSAATSGAAHVRVAWENETTGTTGSYIRSSVSQQLVTTSALGTYLNGSITTKLNQNRIMKVYGWQNTGSAQTVTATIVATRLV